MLFHAVLAGLAGLAAAQVTPLFVDGITLTITSQNGLEGGNEIFALTDNASNAQWSSAGSRLPNSPSHCASGCRFGFVNSSGRLPTIEGLMTTDAITGERTVTFQGAGRTEDISNFECSLALNKAICSRR